ncbi:MAG TPA: hypothetical protein VLF91_06050 [Candidatus Saccharimonadales bacterium]|nr:hypothetical protein [Candidatus Saccharimonadales bacterium]
MSRGYVLGPAARELKETIDAGVYVPSLETYDTPALLEDKNDLMGAIRPEMYEIGAVIASDITLKMHQRMHEAFHLTVLLARTKTEL